MPKLDKSGYKDASIRFGTAGDRLNTGVRNTKTPRAPRLRFPASVFFVYPRRPPRGRRQAHRLHIAHEAKSLASILSHRKEVRPKKFDQSQPTIFDIDTGFWWIIPNFDISSCGSCLPLFSGKNVGYLPPLFPLVSLPCLTAALDD